MGLLGRLAAGFTLLLITFIAYSSQIFVIWPWYGREVSIELIYLLLPFNLLVAMLLWNYILCARTNPGRVPASWEPDLQAKEGYEVKKYTRKPRFCRTCKKYKPPRAHHCSQCKTCVLRMDHHCPWVNNCVGHYNYGHFIRFLFYIDVACSYHLAMVTRRVLDEYTGEYWVEPSVSELVFIILNYVTCVPVLLAVGGFSIYHLFCLLGNSTTIEGWEKDKAATLIRRGQIREIRFPYNLGKKGNIEAVLGKNPLWWCWPTVPPGDGLKYELAPGNDDDEAQWPPTDPTAYYNHTFTLPSDPWTYENGSLNPDLQPSNSSSLRERSSTSRRMGATASSVPPYHPDFDEQDADDHDSEDDYWNGPAQSKLFRRGSEGYEVRPINREEMLHRYVDEQEGMQGRYNIYAPEIPSGSESASEDEAVDNGYLASKME